jgi:hypothetical protein
MLFAEFDCVVGIFNGFEMRHVASAGGFLVHVAPIDTVGNDFVVGLEEDLSVAEVVEKADYGGLDVKRV